MMIYFFTYVVLNFRRASNRRASVFCGIVAAIFLLFTQHRALCLSLTLFRSHASSVGEQNLNISLLGTFGNQLNSSWTTKPYTEKSMCAWAIFSLHYTCTCSQQQWTRHGWNNQRKKTEKSIHIDFSFFSNKIVFCGAKDHGVQPHWAKQIKINELDDYKKKSPTKILNISSFHLHSFRLRPNFRSCNFCCISANDTILFQCPAMESGRSCEKK